MKKSLRFLCMAALVLMGATMTGCSDNFMDEPSDGKVTLTTTVKFGEVGTKALTSTGVKTFAEGDYIAIVYKNATGNTVTANSAGLNAGDISADGKTATFTVTLEERQPNSEVRYIYPGYMRYYPLDPSTAVASDATIDYSRIRSQNGSLYTLGHELDLAIFDGSLDGTKLPANPTLDNKLAILALTLKDKAGSASITSGLKRISLYDGTNNYDVWGQGTGAPFAADTVYVAIRPTDEANITVSGTDGTNYYTKYLTGKTYEVSNGYNISLRMAEVTVLNGQFTVNGSGDKVKFSGGNLQATWNGSAWSWAFAEHQWDYIGAAVANNRINGNGSVSDAGTVDYFGWSTGATYFGIHNSNDNTTYNGSFVEWGNTIGTGWHTLTKDEWLYVFNSRPGSTVNGTSHSRYTQATINTDGTGVKGVILFPDGVNFASSEFENLNAINGSSQWGTNCTTEQWAALAAKGCVFLPAAGQRGSSIYGVGSQGRYWSSTLNSATQSRGIFFYDWQISPDGFTDRYYASSVRLVYVVH